MYTRETTYKIFFKSACIGYKLPYNSPMPQTKGTNRKVNKMNKSTLIQLLEDGATFDAIEYKFFHASFRKGFRTIKPTSIAWLAVQREHGIFGTCRLVQENNIYRLK